MSDLTRRHFVEAAAASAAALALAAPRAAEAGGEASTIDLAADGVTLTPRQYGELLARLAVDPGIETDEYSRGGTVAALEMQFAALLGKETAVFMPSGTLANHLAVRALAGPR